MIPFYGPLETIQLLSVTFFLCRARFSRYSTDSIKIAHTVYCMLEIWECVRIMHLSQHICSCRFIKCVSAQYPKAFHSAFPQPQEQLYLHVLNCTPIYSTTGYDNRRIVFYNLLNDKSSFGILSLKSMPQVKIFTWICFFIPWIFFKRILKCLIM